MGRRLGLLLLLPLALACASAIQTAHDRDPEVRFERFASYAWIDAPPRVPEGAEPHGGYLSPADRRRVVTAVDAELAAKGYRRVASPDAADLVVSYAVGRKEQVRVTSAGGGRRRYYQGYDYGRWHQSSEVLVEAYTEGSLSIEFYDPASKRAVWVGWASKRLSRDDDPEVVLREAVARALEPFPVRGEAAPEAGASSGPRPRTQP